MQTRFLMEVAAISAGCLSGVLHSSRRNFDIVGITVIGIATGIGGGVIRDLLIGQGPALAIKTPKYLLIVFISISIGMFVNTLIDRLSKPLWIIDSLALGFFTVAGIQRALAYDIPWISAIFLGVIASVGGGILRDILCRETPIILLPGRPYSLTSLVTGIFYVIFAHFLELPYLICEFIAISIAFSIQMLSAYYDWHVPTPPDLYLMIENQKHKFQELIYKIKNKFRK